MSVRLKRRINSKIAERKDPGGSFADEPPKFSLRYLQESHSIVRCTTEERLGFVDAMHKRQDIPWSQLETMPPDAGRGVVLHAQQRPPVPADRSDPRVDRAPGRQAAAHQRDAGAAPCNGRHTLQLPHQGRGQG